VATDSGTDAGSGSDAGSDAGPTFSWDPGTIPATGVYASINPTAGWCPTGGVAEIRLWDNDDNNIPNVDELHIIGGGASAPLGSAGVELINSTINVTVFCRTGSGLYMGYYSPHLTGATNGATGLSLGMRMWISSVEIPVYVGWDIQFAYSATPRSSDFRRFQFQASLAMSDWLTTCAPGTCTP
jgi:hypothetical protein